jgi:hypothetical protein
MLSGSFSRSGSWKLGDLHTVSPTSLLLTLHLEASFSIKRCATAAEELAIQPDNCIQRSGTECFRSPTRLDKDAVALVHGYPALRGRV